MSSSSTETAETFETVSAVASGVLNNPAARKALLFRTSWCRFSKELCRYGVRCDRAHSEEELQPKKCLWKNFCFKLQNYLGPNCPFHHDCDGDFDTWVRRVKSRDYMVNSAQLCPHMHENSPCKSKTCNFAHTVQGIKFHGECRNRRSECKCLFHHDGETRELFLQRTASIVAEPWMYNLENWQPEDEPSPSPSSPSSQPSQPSQPSVTQQQHTAPQEDDDVSEELLRFQPPVSYTPSPIMTTFMPINPHMLMNPSPFHMTGPSIPPTPSTGGIPGMMNPFEALDLTSSLTLDQLYAMREDIRHGLVRQVMRLKTIQNTIDQKEKESSETTFLQDQNAWMMERYGQQRAGEMMTTIQAAVASASVQ